MKKNNLLLLMSTTLICSSLYAAPKVNPSNVPLETGIGSLVKPNLMFIFDNSSSMARSYLGDAIGGSNVCTGYYAPTQSSIGTGSWTVVKPQVNHTTQAACDATLPPNVGPGTNMGDIKYRCAAEGYNITPKVCTGQVGDNGQAASCTGGEWVYYNYHIQKAVVQVVSGKAGYRWLGDRPCNYTYGATTFEPLPPYAAYDVNKQYYNPKIIYQAGVDYLGNSLGDQSITSARLNPYTGNAKTVVNLLSQATEPYWCTTKTPTADELNDSNVCRRSGVDGDNPFHYYDTATSYPNDPYYYYVRGPAPVPFYYNIIPIEFCDDSGINCAFIQNTTYPTPFHVRWCTSWAHASNLALISGAGKCQANYDATYKYPRYGKFERVNVPPSQYTNYANWFTYYRTRMHAMQTSTGLAFASVDSGKRVGFISLNTPSSFLPVEDFTTTGGTSSQKAKFYAKLYGLTTTGDTDLKKSLSQVGRYFAGISSGISAGMINGTTYKDPVQYSCQQNFTLLATDGYWNPGTNGTDLSGNNITNTDNINSSEEYSLRIDGVYDGGLAGSTGTLSDVALYYYKNPLRSADLGNCFSYSSGDLLPQNLCGSNVPISALDQNPKQHMITYAMSLGLSGLMKYTKDYNYGTSQDLQNVKNGTIGACPWISGSTGVCNWPVPAGNDPAALDDLWHATISGRGKYFSAKDSSEAISSLQDALTSVSAQTGSSAAAATSSPNITATDNSLFYVTYRTSKWDGEINATTIDSNTGVINPTNKWSARTLLNGKVSSASDTRNIYYVRNGSGTSTLRAFTEANLNSNELDNFKDKCSSGADNLSQCINLGQTNKAKVNEGKTLITYLRGQSQYDVNNSAEPLYRQREYVLGDIVNSSPVYVSKPTYGWGDSGYSLYASSNANRAPTLYVGANDGMIHAFDAVTGQERWAVIPAQMMNKLYKLADTTYATNHSFFVDGTISIMDAKIGSSWKTVLIAGMGAGGKGYIALDITNPTAPTVLWEMCESNVCSISDSEIGYSYGNPIITKRKFDNKWVAYLPAGYDNSSAKGLIYEVDLADGSILRKLYTGTGNTSPLYSQSGISRINAYYSSFNQDNSALSLYAGDLDGKVWKWDLSDSNHKIATLLGQATDANGNAQPITTKIELGRVNGNSLLFFGTGKFLNNGDYTNDDVQSVYAVKDSNTSYGKFRNNSSLVKQTINPGSLASTTTNNDVDLSVHNGWYFDLKSQLGERVNVDPALALGVLNLVSNIPGTSACTSGGSAWMYQIDFASGKAVDKVNGFIAKKMTTGLVVGQAIVQLGSTGGLKNYVTDASGKVTAISVPTGNGATEGKLKKYFWKEIQKK